MVPGTRLNRKENMSKTKELLMITVMAFAILTITGVAKADTKSVTPGEFVSSVASVPGKLSNHFQNEWVEIKAYQAKNWADMKKKWQSLTSKFQD